MNIIRIVFFILVCFPSFIHANDLDFDELLIPKFVKAQIVTDDMKMNGVDLGIIQFYTDRPFRDLEMYYRQQVGEINVSIAGDWKIISWLSDKNKKLNTVQATYDSFKKVTHGYISLSNLPTYLQNRKKKELGKDFPAVKGSVFLNDIYSTDMNKESRTLILNNSSPVRYNIYFYKNTYERRGWKVDQLSIGKTGLTGAMMLSKRGNELNITANKDAKTSLTNIVVVQVDK